MKQNIDFDNAFTGSLLTEDFFDNMDNSQIAQAAGLDGDIIPEQGMRMQLQLFIGSPDNKNRGIGRNGWTKFSLKNRAVVIERILNASPLFVDAQVVACGLTDNKEEVKPVEWNRADIPDDENTIEDWLNDYRVTDVDVVVNFDIYIMPAKKMSYERFYKLMMQLTERLGHLVPVHCDNACFIQIYNTDKPDRYGEFACSNGNVDAPTEMKMAYSILYDEMSDSELDGRQLAQTLKWEDNVRMAIDAYNKVEGKPWKINMLDLKKLDDWHIVIPLEFHWQDTMKKEVAARAGYINYLIKKYIMPCIPSVCLDSMFIAASVRSDVKIAEVDNKSSRMPWNEEGTNDTEKDKEINNAVRAFPQVLNKNNKQFETMRYTVLDRMRDNVRMYVIYPLANGYLAKSPDDIDCANSSFLPFIKNKL